MVENQNYNVNYKKDKKYNNKYNKENKVEITDTEVKAEVVENEVAEAVVEVKEVETAPIVESTPVKVDVKPVKEAVPTPKKTVRRKGRIIY